MNNSVQGVQKPKLFWLVRLEDISGVSGDGTVAEGIQFHDKQCVISWFGRFHTLEIAPNIEEIEGIHGHGGATRIVWEHPHE